MTVNAGAYRCPVDGHRVAMIACHWTGSVPSARPMGPGPSGRHHRRGMKRFTEHKVAVDFCLVGLDGSDDIQTVISAALQAGSWQVVVVGGGLPTSDELLKLLKPSSTWCGDAAAIAFNARAGDTFDAATRWLHHDLPWSRDRPPERLHRSTSMRTSPDEHYLTISRPHRPAIKAHPIQEIKDSY